MTTPIVESTNTSPDEGTARIASLRAELRDDAPWVATPTPRVSWTVSAPGAWRQSWVELRSGSDLVRLDTPESVLVSWPFSPLVAGEERMVRVRVASEDGAETPWSTALAVRSAVVENWIARPIALFAPDAVARPALMRRTFRVERAVRRAVLHHSALGAAEMLVNGAVSDDGVLSPGWTSYELRRIHDSADVTTSIRQGENVLAARLAGAWFTEEYHVLTKPRRFHGDQPLLDAQLHLEYEDGSSEIIATDEQWRAVADPAILRSGIYAGEDMDARAEPIGWDVAGFDDVGWHPATLDGDRWPVPVARMSPPVRRIENVAVRSVLTSASGSPILDFGQNLVGRLRIRVRGRCGETITLRHAEVLDGGELALRPLRLAAATDTYTLAGGPEELWEPRFTFHGFRYAQLDGWPGAFDPADVEAVVVHTDMRRTGWFDSSDEQVNRLHENVVWTMRGNYLSVPMDCPQRDERLGWTGDTQLFAPTAAFLFDAESFFISWLRDLVLEQRENGGIVPLFAPNVVPGFANRGPIAAWGDAIAIIPAVLADAHGDLDLLSELYPAMLQWTDAVQNALDADALWTAGRQLGDWLDPNAPPNAPARGRTDTEIVATAYAVRTARLVASLAADLGHDEDAIRLHAAAERSRRAFLAAYVTPGGRMMCDTQTAYALAIAFDLAEEPLRSSLGDRLAQVVRRDGFHIATGLVGTAVVAQALTSTGHVDVAENLLLQTESPSWLFPVTVGATTVWERWDGLRPDGSLNPGAMVSFNHVALGSVAAWLHSDVAGLSSAARGYGRVRIAPTILRRMDHARVVLHTPYGEASSGWERYDGGIRVTAVIPPNTSADVELPDGRRFEVASGPHVWNIEDLPRPPRRQLTLDSSMAALADDPVAYRAFHAALEASPNRFVAKAVRTNALYRDTLSIRDTLVFADAPTLDSVAAGLAQAAADEPEHTQESRSRQ